MGGGNMQQIGFTGAGIHPYLRHLAAIYPGKVRAAAPFFFIPMNGRRHKPAVLGQADAGPFGFINRSFEINTPFTVLDVDDKAILPQGFSQLAGTDAVADDAENAAFYLVRGVKNRPTADHSPTGCRRRTAVADNRGRRFHKMQFR